MVEESEWEHRATVVRYILNIILNMNIEDITEMVKDYRRQKDELGEPYSEITETPMITTEDENGPLETPTVRFKLHRQKVIGIV